MKKILLVLLCAGVATVANAQKSEVTAAKSSWVLLANSGAKPLPETLKLIEDGLAHTDKAIAHEKSKDMPEAWSYRALLASRAALIDTLDFANSKAKQVIAEEAIEKATTLDKKGEEKENIQNAKLNVDDAVRNRGVFAYRKKDLPTALESFNEVTKRNPQDTFMFVNAAVIARELKNYPEVARNYKAAIALNHPESNILYKDLISIQFRELKDSTAAIALIQEASAKFPDDSDLIGMETDYYMKKGDLAKSQAMLTKLIEKNPTNDTYQVIMGDTYFKQATDIQDKRNKVDPKKVKEFNELGAQMKTLLDKSLPYYKAAIAINPKNEIALDKLKSIYFFKDDKTNLDAIQKQIDALK
jgi:predicted Zn-dependent protease